MIRIPCFCAGNHGDPTEDGNVINVTFAIYALNNETHLDKEVSFTTKITVGREVMYSEPFTVKLVPRVDAKKVKPKVLLKCSNLRL